MMNTVCWAFFLSDELIRETYEEVCGKMALNYGQDPHGFTAKAVQTSPYLEGFFHSMLSYFRGVDRPPDQILVLKLKELLINLMQGDPTLAAYFNSLSDTTGPSLSQIMENNFLLQPKAGRLC